MEPSPLSLNELIAQAKVGAPLEQDLTVTGLSYDSRLVEKGDLFFAIGGSHVDGHEYLAEVAQKGAVAAVVERRMDAPIPLVYTPSTVQALSKISDLFFHQPSRHIPVIGVTGTNGKTTTTFLIEAILKSAGKTCGVMGTVNYRIGSREWPAPNTTPMALDVHKFIFKAKKNGAAAVVMEVSSHALELNRVDDVHFEVGVFTNLTQDHLDFHKTMGNYFAAKSKLFIQSEKTKAVVNIDDEYGARLAASLTDVLTYGFGEKAELRVEKDRSDLQGVCFTMVFPSGRGHIVQTNLLGRHNIYNCLAAAGALLAWGLSEEEIVAGLGKKHAVPGRLERVEMGQGFVVAVDYAHTDDALAQVLKTLRDTGPRRLICVFGAGGDRDKGKRPKMGAVAVNLADYVYVTSDNPRTEDPAQILKDIEAGIKKAGKKNYVLIENREQAIEKAIRECADGDIVLIAGKGHETYQIIGDKKIHFSDFEVAKKVLSTWN